MCVSLRVCVWGGGGGGGDIFLFSSVESSVLYGENTKCNLYSLLYYYRLQIKSIYATCRYKHMQSGVLRLTMMLYCCIPIRMQCVVNNSIA